MPQVALRQTLRMVAQAAATAVEPWWIISSAAAALHGASVANVGDVDLLMSTGDARNLLERLGLPPAAGTASPLFKSAVFGCWRDPPLPVEIMGGFQVATDEGWCRVSPASCQPMLVDGLTVFVPSRQDLVGLLRLFGRPKDLERARLLEKLPR